MDDWVPEIVLQHLDSYASVYRGSNQELLAYTVKQYLLLAMQVGRAEVVLKDPRLQGVLMEAQLATSCGWRSDSNIFQHTK